MRVSIPSARGRGTLQSAMAFRTSQLLTNFAEKSADGMLTTDVNGIITWANPAAGKLLGWSVHQLVSQHISVFCAPEVIYRYASLQGRVLSGEAVFDAAATVLRRGWHPRRCIARMGARARCGRESQRHVVRHP